MANQLKINDTTFNVGDIIKVFYKVIESEKTSGVKKHEEKEEIHERYQPFEGVVLSINCSKGFTVRKIGADNIGIERTFPANSPWINKITVTKKGTFRRAKLYFKRGTTSKR